MLEGIDKVIDLVLEKRGHPPLLPAEREATRHDDEVLKAQIAAMAQSAGR
jgi:hypothetical protein